MRFTQEQFLAAWEHSSGIQEAAKQLGIIDDTMKKEEKVKILQGLQNYASKMRKALAEEGLELRAFRGKYPKIDIKAAKVTLKKLRAGKKAEKQASDKLKALKPKVKK